MTNNTVTPLIEFWFPTDVWGLIASLLDSNELARFRQVCKSFNDICSDAMILQPLYNRLFTIDNTLPADYQTAGKTPLVFFKKAFEKIQARQQQEITYLITHHAAVMTTLKYAAVLQQNTSVTLKSLEAKHALLDAVNSEIVTARITINSPVLNLNSAHITRLPVTLFKAAGYTNFWQNLTRLDCENNQLAALNVTGLTALKWLNCENNQLAALNVTGLTALQTLACGKNQLAALNLQELTALETLDCYNNQLTTLNVPGLAALHLLNCSNNQLTALNLTGLAALQWLWFCHNPLTDLNLTGIPVAIKNKHAELEKSLLFKQLSQTGSPEIRQALIARLGGDYTYQNCLHYCPVYTEKLFMIDSVQACNLALSALSLHSAYLPYSGASNNICNAQQKRTRDEEKTQDNNQIEQEGKEPGDELAAKRRKKKAKA